jgi:hypothetical protein
MKKPSTPEEDHAHVSDYRPLMRLAAFDRPPATGAGEEPVSIVTELPPGIDIQHAGRATGAGAQRRNWRPRRYFTPELSGRSSSRTIQGDFGQLCRSNMARRCRSNRRIQRNGPNNALTLQVEYEKAVATIELTT